MDVELNFLQLRLRSESLTCALDELHSHIMLCYSRIEKLHMSCFETHGVAVIGTYLQRKFRLLVTNVRGKVLSTFEENPNRQKLL